MSLLRPILQPCSNRYHLKAGISACLDYRNRDKKLKRTTSHIAWHSPHRSSGFTLPPGRQDLSRGSWVNPIPSPGSGKPSQDVVEAARSTAGGRGAALPVPGIGPQTEV